MLNFGALLTCEVAHVIFFRTGKLPEVLQGQAWLLAAAHVFTTCEPLMCEQAYIRTFHCHRGPTSATGILNYARFSG